jgi:HAD superfamily hydrolase (TIGR01509 family)
MSRLKAICCDLDGTLVNSEPYWFAAEFDLVGQFGGQWSQAQAEAVIGSHLPNTAEALRAAGVDLPGDVIIDRLTALVESKVRAARPFMPGALELLRAARAAGLALALVTMSYKRTTDMIEELEPGLFDVVVTGDAVAQGKPHPEPYLAAARLLGLEPSQCVAIEDSPTGVASAMAAGMPTVAVPLNATVPPMAGLSRVANLGQLDLALLGRLANGETVDLL